MILSRGQALMILKPVELPPAVARAFVKDMKSALSRGIQKSPGQCRGFCVWKNTAVQYLAATDPPNL
jgi:hypothetical protein